MPWLGADWPWSMVDVVGYVTYLPIVPTSAYLLQSHSIRTPVFNLFDPVRDGGLYTNSYTRLVTWDENLSFG